MDEIVPPVGVVDPTVGPPVDGASSLFPHPAVRSDAPTMTSTAAKERRFFFIDFIDYSPQGLSGPMRHMWPPGAFV